ncbi:nucleotidyltransferase family protein [Streptomyces sp. WP-1]|uniref:nucleotidyltransferase family protein n=1 Tax=Streptomyces sp. WP-1 TaxID=3041497 RepID=UPI0026484DAC|nr:nucleotidyltransferase family protein [Streptomyces sp. WP-1]WKE73394.1 nucleotidyltransferase family protein [Streptomyces sp. WP-1]
MAHHGEETASVRRQDVPEATGLRLATDPTQPGAGGVRPDIPPDSGPQPQTAPGQTPRRPAPPDAGSPPQPPPADEPETRPGAPDLPHDRSQAILEAAKRIGALLKRAGHPFALAGSVAVYAHGGSRYLQHDADFCVLPDDADAVAATLHEAGFAVRTPPEDWLLKTTCQGQNVDIIFTLAHQPVTAEMLDRAHVLPVDSVLMPVLCPTDLIRSLISAFCEHYCDFGAVLPVARAMREKVDWDVVRDTCGEQPMPAAFLFLLERLNVIAPREDRP